MKLSYFILFTFLLILQSCRGEFYSKSSGIETITANNYNNIVKNRNDNLPWILEFYAPWCGHCKSLKPDYVRLAKRLKGIVHIGAVDCDDQGNQALAQRFGIKGFPTLKVIDPRNPNNPIEYNGQRTFTAMSSFVLNYLRADIAKVTSSNLESFLESSSDSLLLFTNKDKATPLLRSIGARFSGVLNIGIIKDSQKDIMSRFSISKVPSLVLNHSTHGVQVYNGKLGAHEISHWLGNFVELPTKTSKSGSKSQSKSSDMEDYIITLTSSNFDDFVMESKSAWMVEFYAPWCGHCKALAPQWKKASKSWKGIVKYGIVDCTVEKSLCSRFSVEGYPTIKYSLGIESNKKRKHSDFKPYQGARSAKDISSFSSTLLPDFTRKVNNVFDVTKVFKEMKNGEFASLLITEKGSVPSLYKALTLEMKHVYSYMGVMLNSTPESAKRLSKNKVSSLPAIGLVKKENGSPVFEFYSGEFNMKSLFSFYTSFAGNSVPEEKTIKDPTKELKDEL